MNKNRIIEILDWIMDNGVGLAVIILIIGSIIKSLFFG